MWENFLYWWKTTTTKEPVKIPEAQASKPANQPKPIEPIKPPRTKRKIVIIVGHSTKDGGAVAYNGEQEFAYNSKVANLVKTILDQTSNFECKILSRNPNHPYRHAMQVLAQEIKIWKADFSLELHFNAAEGKAYGCEILLNEDHPNADKLIKIADKWTDDLAKEFNLVERGRYKYKDGTFGDGVKLLKSGERGYYNMHYLHPQVPISLLIEPMFANLKTKESEQFFGPDGYKKYADFLARKIIEL